VSDIPTPEVVHTLELSPNWHEVAVQHLVNFFESRGQLKNAFRGEGGRWNLVVRFTDDKQAEAFMEALRRNELREFRRPNGPIRGLDTP